MLLACDNTLRNVTQNHRPQMDIKRKNISIKMYKQGAKWPNLYLVRCIVEELGEVIFSNTTFIMTKMFSGFTFFILYPIYHLHTVAAFKLI